MTEKNLNNVGVEIRLNGDAFDFSLLRLHQTMHGHHRFTVKVNGRNRKGIWNDSPDGLLKRLLGASVQIRISERAGASTEFVGMVDKVDLGGKDGDGGFFRLYGGSPTLLMTDDRSMDSFVDTDFASIVQQTLSGLNLSIEHRITPLNNVDIPFVYRYGESSYDFLRRLAVSCGESLYYDGKKMVVGFPKEKSATVTLDYRHDLLDLNISSALGQYELERYDYDPGQDRILQYPSPDGCLLDSFASHAYRKSKEIFPTGTVLPCRLGIRSRVAGVQATDGIFSEYFGKVSDGSLLRAHTRTCKPFLGGVVKFEREAGKYDGSLGRFRIMEVTHVYDHDKGEYLNDIVGINSEFNYIPARDVRWPTAFPEVAEVVDNRDPENMGRVKVSYVWQRLEDHPLGKTSGWMRVQTPDAGSGAAVPKGRGFLFVPEVGDQVMVGYEYGDPDRPFVMGSLFHCNNTDGIAADNAVKGIRTRSGHTVEFNDQKGSESITIKDMNGNSIVFNTNGQSISVRSIDQIDLSAKNIHINADENMVLSIGKQMETTVGGNYIETVGENKTTIVNGSVGQNIEKDVSVNINGDATLEILGDGKNSMKRLTIEASEKAQISSSGKMTIASGEEVDISQG